jgi:hypothetical protein
VGKKERILEEKKQRMKRSADFYRAVRRFGRAFPISGDASGVSEAVSFCIAAFSRTYVSHAGKKSPAQPSTTIAMIRANL